MDDESGGGKARVGEQQEQGDERGWKELIGFHDRSGSCGEFCGREDPHSGSRDLYLRILSTSFYGVNLEA